ncbi:MAG: DUF4178 domain-containing protein [Bacteroidota bacterium]
MGLFDSFKKKFTPKPAPEDINLTNLVRGDLFDYDLSSWEVKEVYLYDWGNEHFSREYKISNGRDTAFLSVDRDEGELDMFLTRKVNVRAIQEDLPEILTEEGEPPTKLYHDGYTFLLEGERPGYYKPEEASDKAWEEFISWEYADETDTLSLTLEQWDEKIFEAAYGKRVQPHEITNLLPGD